MICTLINYVSIHIVYKHVEQSMKKQHIVVLDSGGSCCKLGLAGDAASLMYVD